MFTVTIQNKNYSVEKTGEDIRVNDKVINWDLNWLSPRKIHLIHNHKSIEAELVSINKITKTATIKLGNKLSVVQLKDRFDLLLKEMGMDLITSTALKEIAAPMPGLILDLLVKEGDEVKKGDPLLILEAMKMENIIKSPRDGKVKTVKISLHQSVEKNQVLIQF
jgi:biotin carboxyl carrier protein